MVDFTDLFSGELQVKSDLLEYFFLISPPQSLKEEVKRLKQKLKWQVGLDDYNLHSPAHISLFKINDADNWAGSAHQREFLSAIPSFKIKIVGHEVFKHGNKGRSLVLKIEDPKPIRSIFRALVPADAPYAATMKPHITIARNIPVPDFEKITYLSEYDLQAEFVCDKIMVLKKQIYNPGRYEMHCEMSLSKENSF